MNSEDLAKRLHSYCLRIWMEYEEETTHDWAAHQAYADIYIQHIQGQEDLEDIPTQQVADTIVRLGMPTGQNWERHPHPDRVIEELRRARQIKLIPD